MKKRKILYHGSNRIVSAPRYGAGREDNDYGQGFYCTEAIELAKEWACQTLKDGFISCYELDIKELSVLNLTDSPYHVLHWLALLNDNRKPSISTKIGEEATVYLREKYLLDISGVDVMIGYRADDSYFSFARNFLNNQITLKQLERSMQLGELGEQIVLKSEKAFRQIHYQNFETVPGNVYFHRRQMRDEKARTEFQMDQRRGDADGIYMIDLIRGREGL